MAVEHRGLEGPLADVAAVGAGVAVQGAADGAGDADQRFQAGQPAMDGRGDRAAQQGAAAGGERAALDANLAERRGGEVDHHAGHAFVADQDVRALAQQAHLDALLVAAPHQGDQLVGGFRLGEVLGRPAQLEPRVHRQRLALPHDLLKTGQKTHVQSFMVRIDIPLSFFGRNRRATSPAPSVTSTSPGARWVSRVRTDFFGRVARQHVDAQRGRPAGRDRPP